MFIPSRGRATIDDEIEKEARRRIARTRIKRHPVKVAVGYLVWIVAIAAVIFAWLYRWTFIAFFLGIDPEKM